METIQVIAHGQKELRQVVQRTTVGVNLTPGEGLLNQNLKNTVEIPVKETSHHENDSEFEAF